MVVPHCFPSQDEEFRAAVEHALRVDGMAPETAAETLRARYPRVAVRPREHAITLEISPDHEVWYFYRDGTAYSRSEQVAEALTTAST
jgi:hypothetical protein